VFIGTYAGFKGGNADKILMVFTDIFLTIPGLPLVIVLVSLFNPQSPLVIGILLAINNWPGLARTIRSQVLTIREESYVEASRATGMRTRTILGRDIIPQLMPYISINYMNATRGIIAESVGLYFIGLLPYSSLNWGVLLNQAYGIGLLSNPGNWYRLIIPLITIVGFSLGLILLAQALDRIFNPRVRARHSETTPDTEDEEIESGGGPTMGPGI
jgi:peptide/nickel transport system permease protein